MLQTKMFGDVLPRRDIPPLVTGVLLGLSATLLLTGCAERNIHAGSREIPLTSGSGMNVLPYYSADGKRVLYTANERMNTFTIHVVPAQGGDALKVTAEPVPLIAVGWADREGQIWTVSYTERDIQRMSLSGELREGLTVPEFAGLARVSDDGRTALWCKFTGDNCDLVKQDLVSGEMELLDTTLDWEMDSCFGPGPGDITLVRGNAYNATASRMFIRWADTGTTEPLILPEGKVGDPAWSPDRRFLAFVCEQGGNADLWIHDPETKRSIQLTATPESESHPDWSPDGEWITFSRATRTSNLFLGDPRTYETRPLTKGKARDMNPRLSPDAEWVAFFRMHPATSDQASRTVICVASLESREVKELDLAGLTPVVEEWVFGWSPDASEFAFPADDGSGNVDIYRVVRDGGVPERVTIEPGMDSFPSWSPDGMTIAYMRMAGGQSQIWTIPAHGGLATQISRGPGMKYSATWSPDSERLAYSRMLDPREVELWVVSTREPSQTHRVLEGDTGNWVESWTPDGRNLLVWKMAKDAFAGYLVSEDGSRVQELGRAGKDESEHFIELNETGKRYFDLVYPGGVHVFPDGEKMSNIYTMRVPEAIAAGFRANKDS
jgi:Tol biopolymer transport system component